MPHSILHSILYSSIYMKMAYNLNNILTIYFWVSVLYISETCNVQSWEHWVWIIWSRWQIALSDVKPHWCLTNWQCKHCKASAFSRETDWQTADSAFSFSKQFIILIHTGVIYLAAQRKYLYTVVLIGKTSWYST